MYIVLFQNGNKICGNKVWKTVSMYSSAYFFLSHQRYKIFLLKQILTNLVFYSEWSGIIQVSPLCFLSRQNRSKTLCTLCGFSSAPKMPRYPFWTVAFLPHKCFLAVSMSEDAKQTLWPLHFPRQFAMSDCSTTLSSQSLETNANTASRRTSFFLTASKLHCYVCPYAAFCALHIHPLLQCFCSLFLETCSKEYTAICPAPHITQRWGLELEFWLGLSKLSEFWGTQAIASHRCMSRRAYAPSLKKFLCLVNMLFTLNLTSHRALQLKLLVPASVLKNQRSSSN